VLFLNLVDACLKSRNTNKSIDEYIHLIFDGK